MYTPSSPTEFSVNIERIVIKYNIEGNNNVIIGKVHTPLNYWNNSYHHGRVFFHMLADEYLRLSYHRLRVKDKSFNATMETHFDNSIEKIGIVSQDIGRVILNLFTNAFYSVNKKSKTAADNYKPAV